MLQMVFVKASQVLNFGDGVFGIEIPDRDLTLYEVKVIENLLPDLSDKFYELLAKQAVLNCIVGRPTSDQPVLPVETEARRK